MPSKNDLSAFKAARPASPVLAAQPHVDKPVGTRGRRAKTAADKESETLALKLTKAEMAALERNAGMIPKGSFIKHILRTQTDAFK